MHACLRAIHTMLHKELASQSLSSRLWLQSKHVRVHDIASFISSLRLLLRVHLQSYHAEKWQRRRNMHSVASSVRHASLDAGCMFERLDFMQVVRKGLKLVGAVCLDPLYDLFRRLLQNFLHLSQKCYSQLFAAQKFSNSTLTSPGGCACACHVVCPLWREDRRVFAKKGHQFCRQASLCKGDLFSHFWGGSRYWQLHTPVVRAVACIKEGLN